MGELAVAQVQRLLAGEPPLLRMLETTLLVRGST
jgi:hypothetical protein